MKIKLLLLILVFALPNMYGQDRKIANSKLNSANVFFKGAELTHSASALLAQGENEMWIEGLSPEIDKNSLKIKASNGVVISAFEYSVDFLSSAKTPTNPMVKKMEDSVDIYRQKVVLIDTDIKVNNQLIDILKKSTDKNIAGSEKGMPIDELIKTMDYYKNKLTVLENTQRENEKQKSEWNFAITRLSNQVRQESVKNNKSAGVLKLNLSSPLAVTANFTITYYTPSAGWVPYYDINIESTDKPIKFVSKAKVRQTTGLDWAKVKLTLSSATPSNGKVAPLFSVWFLQNQSQINRLRGSLSGVMAQNSYSYDSPAAMLEMNEVVVSGYGTTKKDKATQPIYMVDGTPVDADYFAEIDRNMVKSETFLTGKDAEKRYGVGAKDGVYVMELKSSMDDYVTQADSDLEMAFNIDIPYSVPGNGKEQSITLPTKEAQGEFKYYCAPKLDKEVYLLAEIADWQKLGLLSGKANITYDGTYVGETFIDAASTQDKLALTLGADKRVVVKREKVQDYNSGTNFLGNDVKQAFAYKLTVRNNQRKAVKLVLKDQYPRSQDKGIEVEFLQKETTPFTANKQDVGVITWEEELAAGQSKEYKIAYTVKYPKGSNLNL